MQEAGLRSLERAFGGIARYKAIEWATYVDKQGLPRFSLPPHSESPAALETSKALVKRSSNDADAGCRSGRTREDLRAVALP